MELSSGFPELSSEYVMFFIDNDKKGSGLLIILVAVAIIGIIFAIIWGGDDEKNLNNSGPKNLGERKMQAEDDLGDIENSIEDYNKRIEGVE